MANSFHEQNAVVHYDGMLENFVNAVKSAYEDEGFDPSSSLVTEAALNAFLMEAYEQEVFSYGSISVEQINTYKDIVRHAYSAARRATPRMYDMITTNSSNEQYEMFDEDIVR